MMISPIFVAIFVSYALFSSTTNAGVMLNETAPAVDQSRKMDGVTAALAQIDGSLQMLKEQAHTWAIFRHHIDAWNAQMQAIEHKLDLIKRTQDEQQVFGNKLTSLEFTLNHILSKVVLMSESCASQDQFQPATAVERLLRDVKGVLNDDRKIESEFGARLSDILRHVQNMGSEKCRGSSTSHGGGGSGGCGGGFKSAMDKALTTVEQKLHKLEKHGKKNERELEQLLRLANRADDRLQMWQLAGEQTLQHCRAVSGELTTFTGSSDLLLKRIELLVHDVSKQRDCQPEIDSEAADPDSEEFVPNVPRETEHDEAEEDNDTEEDGDAHATELDADKSLPCR